jgi:hypothetical protein
MERRRRKAGTWKRSWKDKRGGERERELRRNYAGYPLLSSTCSQPASQPATCCCCCCCKWGCVISILGRLLGFVFVFLFFEN